MWLQRWFRAILEIADWRTSKRIAMSLCDSFFSLINRRISRTSASFSLDIPCWTPRAERRREAISAMFSAWVPRDRCFGLQQGGLSQEWSTSRFPGCLWLAIDQATRWALRILFPMQIRRYLVVNGWPFLRLSGQQSSSPRMSTCDQKVLICALVSRGMMLE